MFHLCSYVVMLPPRRLDPLSLEMRFDGPVMPADPAAPAAPSPGRVALFARLAGERRAAIAARRRTQDAAQATADRQIARWGAALCLYRAMAAGDEPAAVTHAE